MPKVGDISVGSKFQVLIYGKSKVGKTFGALSFPRPVFIDFDKGINTAIGTAAEAKYGKANLANIEFEQFTEKNLVRGVPQSHNAFDDACRYFDKMMAKASTFDTWVIDSGTTLFEVAMNKAICVLGALNISKTQKEGIQYGFLPSKMQDWGAQRNMGEQFVKMVQDSGKHVVFICHEKEVLDDNGNLVGIVPLLTGGSAEAIPLRFDEVYNIRLAKKGPNWSRVCQTEPDALRKCGTRLGVPNNVEWDFNEIMKSIGRGNADTLAGNAVPAASPATAVNAARK